MAYCYPIKAQTRTGEWYELDVPCLVNEEEFLLLRKPDSPILKFGKFIRGCDIPGIFEGDVLLCDGVEYTVLYHRGFILKDADKNVKYLYELKNYEKLRNIVGDDNCDYNFPKKIYFKYRGLQIYPHSIKGATQDRVIIDGVGATFHFEEIGQEARLSYERKKLYFGDLVQGYPLELYYGRPVIKRDNDIYDIVTKTNIEA